MIKYFKNKNTDETVAVSHNDTIRRLENDDKYSAVQAPNKQSEGVKKQSDTKPSEDAKEPANQAEKAPDKPKTAAKTSTRTNTRKTNKATTATKK